MESINWEEKINNILQSSDTEQVSFKSIQTRMKEQNIDCEQKQLIDIVKRFSSLKGLIIEGKKSLKNPHYQQSAPAKTRARNTAATARAAMTKTTDRPAQQQTEHQLEEVKGQISNIHAQISAAVREEVKEHFTGDNDDQLVLDAMREDYQAFNEELLHEQYKEAFNQQDWQKYLADDVQYAAASIKQGCRMGYIALLTTNDRFCDESVRTCSNNTFKLIHVSLKLAQSQKTPSLQLREVQQYNLQWLCNSVAVKEIDHSIQNIITLLDIKK